VKRTELQEHSTGAYFAGSCPAGTRASWEEGRETEFRLAYQNLANTAAMLGRRFGVSEATV
jgi:hypothetical protein